MRDWWLHEHSSVVLLWDTTSTRLWLGGADSHSADGRHQGTCQRSRISFPQGYSHKRTVLVLDYRVTHLALFPATMTGPLKFAVQELSPEEVRAAAALLNIAIPNQPGNTIPLLCPYFHSHCPCNTHRKCHTSESTPPIPSRPHHTPNTYRSSKLLPR